jgi:integrase
VKRSFNTACRLTGIEDLHKHDLRHAFVARSILTGVPPAVVLKASGHSSDEGKRYLNLTQGQESQCRIGQANTMEQCHNQIYRVARKF